MALAKPAIDIGLVAKDIEKQLHFYRDLVGLEDIGPLHVGPITMHRLAIGESLLKLTDRPDRKDTPPPSGLEDSGVRYVTVWVTNLDELTEKLTEAGHPPFMGPMAVGPDKRVALFRDPDENIFELLGK